MNTGRRHAGSVLCVCFPLCLVIAVFAAGVPSSRAEIMDTRTIGWDRGDYQGWPTLAHLPDGRLLLNFTGGKVAHNCPFGRSELMQSHDSGATWSWPQVIHDGALDDRGVGVLGTRRGTLLVSVYTTKPPVSFAPEHADRLTKGFPDGWDAVLLPVASAWRDAVGRLDSEQLQEELGGWVLRSTDGGLTWSPRIRVPVRSWHGPTELNDGRIIYAGVASGAPESSRLSVCHSTDDGLTWLLISSLPLPPDVPPGEFDGPHLVECANGTLLCQIRRLAPGDSAGTVYQSTSTDGGFTWSAARGIDVAGAPTHLLRLSDGRLLMSYGLRVAPFGSQARMSRDHGATWSAPIVISTGADNADLGFTSTVELLDGTFLSVWYERPAGSPQARLRQARWRLEAR